MRFLFIRLAENYSNYAAFVYILAAAIQISLFVFLNSSQGILLTTLKIPSGAIGNYSGSLVLYDELMVIATVYLWGILSDHSGRFLCFSAAFIIQALALVAYPSARSFSPDLVLLRVIFAVGSAAGTTMISACLADFSSELDRGKLSGLVGFSCGIGALIGVFVFLPLPTHFGSGVYGIRIAYYIVAGVAFIMGILLFGSSFYMPSINGELNDSSPIGDTLESPGSNESQVVLQPLDSFSLTSGEHQSLPQTDPPLHRISAEFKLSRKHR